jgi:transcriptional regulator with XRE-family HTH domain
VNDTPGQLLREARRSRGASQARLAIRAGTTQSAISRIERDQVSPSVETLRSLLHLLGADLELGVVERDSGVDRSMVHERLRQSPAERVAYGLGFADFAIETRRANEPAKRAA